MSLHQHSVLGHSLSFQPTGQLGAHPAPFPERGWDAVEEPCPLAEQITQQHNHPSRLLVPSAGRSGALCLTNSRCVQTASFFGLLFLFAEPWLQCGIARDAGGPRRGRGHPHHALGADNPTCPLKRLMGS